MKPLAALTAEDVAPLAGVVFDLDDTLLDHGHLTEAAYSALFRMKEAGFRLIGSTGRPYGWADLLGRQWPVDAMVAENGAAALVRTEDGGHRALLAPCGGRREDLLALAGDLIERFPSARITEDNGARVADVTIDIGERCRVPAADIQAMHAIARARGIVTVASSVHFHLSWETPDKAAGTVRVLGEAFGEDATAARRRYAFIGDSGNDATAFAGFRLTFGVANVRSSGATLTLMPRFVAPSAMGRGFVEIAAALVERRRATSAGSSAASF
jgi:hydroxymethylpyrimidine pyrophosphatase-like HAD family hydrolase